MVAASVHPNPSQITLLWATITTCIQAVKAWLFLAQTALDAEPARFHFLVYGTGDSKNRTPESDFIP